MCGIAGAISLVNGVNPDPVAKMIAGIAHRGPDDSGLWKNENGRCVLGHARLSIIDLTKAGHQPMIDPSTGNCIVFNGEVYNHNELREDCSKLGDVFYSHSDTEVILALYRRYGVKCLQFMSGMFAFALWDRANNYLFMARDRVGKKPFNYCLDSNRLIFCSELNPLAHHPEVSNEICKEGLELYLQLQYIPSPWTIYKNVKKLPPAHYAIYSEKGLQITEYWNVDYKSKLKISEEDALDAFEENLKSAINLRMHADVEVGALLSGGVDSSIIVALMSGMSAEKIKTFSIGFSDNDFNELPFAQQVADRYGTIHHPEILSGEVTGVLDDIVKHYGEPFADSSAVPSFHVSKVARSGLKVVLNGDGGDELLGGYPRYWLANSTMRSTRLLGGLHSPRQLAKLGADLADARSFRDRLKRKWLLRVARPELQSVVMYSDFWNDSVRHSLMGEGSSLLEHWRAHWLEEAEKYATNPIDRMLYIDNRTYLSGDLLVKMDIASMHCGLEARSPLLDHKLIELCASLPLGLKVKDRVGKYLLKKLAERYFPKEFIYRRKMGFGIPLKNWLKGPLRPTVEHILNDETMMEPLRQEEIRKVLQEFYLLDFEHSSRIWSLLMFGLWKKNCYLGC